MKKKKSKNSKAIEIKHIANFIAEAGLLKRIKRSGWWVLGINDPESVADHSFRCAVLGYLLARMEKVVPYKVLAMAVFNDIHEARITDLHKLAQRYIDALPAENKAFEEQIMPLPNFIQEEMRSLRKEYLQQETKESIIARDADILECLIQAKEYYDHGFKEAFRFMKKAPDFLMTASAKMLWAQVKKSNLNEWWEQLSSFTR